MRKLMTAVLAVCVFGLTAACKCREHTIDTMDPIAGEEGKATEVTLTGTKFKGRGHAVIFTMQETLEDDLLPGRPRLGLSQFREVVEKLTRKADGTTPSALIRLAIAETGLVAEIEREGQAVARERKENLDQLVAAAAEYEAREAAPSLAAFLDGVSLLGLAGPFTAIVLGWLQPADVVDYLGQIDETIGLSAQFVCRHRWI